MSQRLHAVWVQTGSAAKVVHLPHPQEPVNSCTPYCGAGKAGNRSLVTTLGHRTVCALCLRKEELYG